MSLERNLACRLCKLGSTVSRTCLLGEPLKRHKVMVVSDAPTQAEMRHDQVEPDELLIEHLEKAGLDVDSIFFCYAVSCPTGKPTKAQIRSCKTWLEAQIAVVKPKFVLLVGSTPLLSVLGETGIKKYRGRPKEINGIVYFPTFSPAYIQYDERQLPILQADLSDFRGMVEHGSIPKEEDLNLRIVRTRKDFQAMLDDLANTNIASYDIETTGLYPWDFGGEIVTIGFGTKTTQWSLPLLHPDVEWHLWEVKQFWIDIDEVLRENGVKLVMHNGKFDCLWSWVKGKVRWHELFHADTMLMHYLLDENSKHGLKFLSKIFCNAPNYDAPVKTKQGAGPLLEHCEYHGLDLLYTRKLYFKFKKMLEADTGLHNVFWKILQPCARLFTEMEYRGVFINTDKMEEAEVNLRNKLRAAMLELNKYGDINWNSPQQVGKLLFQDLKQPVIEKTATGAPSCSESVLKRVKHPVAKALLDFRAANKQLTSFIDGWKPYLHNSRIHPSFKLSGTVTGRLSCEHPNLQQVPRDPVIRTLITAPDGWTLIEVDLSQIELRIAAELANERAMLHAFMTGVDTHWLTMIREIGRAGGQRQIILETASTLTQKKQTNYGEALDVVFKAGPDACAEINPVWKELRKKAKAINFGYLFGMWWRKFVDYARDNYDVIVTDEEAQASREGFFELYPDFEDWHKDQRNFARKHGFVRSLSGRKRRLPAAMRRDQSPEAKEAERQAINSPVQSFANELNLVSLLQLREEFPRKVVQPVATIHDAILIEVRNDYVERVFVRMLEIMSWPKMLDELKIKMSVPIEAEGKIGAWGGGVSLKKWKDAQGQSHTAR